uniref:Uncharacterized protein n=1 Tax=Caenorhabditis japonica TaxID=281687 RepID=A0A8R1IFJ8_CAEJA
MFSFFYRCETTWPRSRIRATCTVFASLCENSFFEMNFSGRERLIVTDETQTERYRCHATQPQRLDD